MIVERKKRKRENERRKEEKRGIKVFKIKVGQEEKTCYLDHLFYIAERFGLRLSFGSFPLIVSCVNSDNLLNLSWSLGFHVYKIDKDYYLIHNIGVKIK